MKKFFIFFISAFLITTLLTACNDKTAETSNTSSVIKTDGDNSVKSQSSTKPLATTIYMSTDLTGEAAFEFELSEDKNSYRIVKYNGLEAEITIPSAHLGKPVETIGYYAFYDCNTIQKVNLPNTIKEIQLCAFKGCLKLEIINIPNSVTEIAESVFKNCSSLKTVNLPDSILKLGSDAFAFSNIESLTLPKSLKYIGDGAFRVCTYLESITFENDSGWFVSTDKNATTGTLVNVTDPTANVEMLKNTYTDYYWFCN